MSYFTYGDEDALIAVGIGKPPGTQQLMPFIAIINSSTISTEAGVNLKSALDEETGDVVKMITDNKGTVIYFDNPEGAQRFLGMLTMALMSAADGDWVHRRETNRSLN
jgi:hypothetical protein